MFSSSLSPCTLADHRNNCIRLDNQDTLVPLRMIRDCFCTYASYFLCLCECASVDQAHSYRMSSYPSVYPCWNSLHFEWFFLYWCLPQCFCMQRVCIGASSLWKTSFPQHRQILTVHQFVSCSIHSGSMIWMCVSMFSHSTPFVKISLAFFHASSLLAASTSWEEMAVKVIS